MSLEEAKKQGALGVFEEKYGQKVSVYAIEDFQKKFVLALMFTTQVN